MHKKLNEISEFYKNLVEKKLYSTIDKLIKKELSEYEDLEGTIQNLYASKSSSAEELVKIKEAILAKTEQIWNTYTSEDFSSFTRNFLEDLFAEIDQIPLHVNVSQSQERFIKQISDSKGLQILKSFKWFFWKISQIPRRITRKKEVYWKHRVPFRMVINKTLVNSLAIQLIPLLDDYYMHLMQAYKDLKAIETSNKSSGEEHKKGGSYALLKKEITKVKKIIKKQLLSYAEENVSKLFEYAEKVGTIEMSPRNFNPSKIEKEFEEANTQWSKRDEGWITTFDTFLESWRSELAMQVLIFKTQAELDDYITNQSKNVREYIGEELDAIDSFIVESINLVESEDEGLITAIKKRIYQTQKKLDQELIPTLLDKLGNKSMINGISKLEAATKQAMDELDSERKIPKVPTDYLSPLEADDITSISPYDIVAFEVAPELSEKLDSIKAELVGQLNENIILAQDLDHMISYSLSSAIDEYKSSEDLHSAKSIAVESLNRSSARVKDIRDSLEKSMKMVNEKISITVENYVDSLEDLTKTENVREIRMRIIRAKAIQSTQEYKDEVRQKIEDTYQRVVNRVKVQFQKLRNFVQRITRHLTTTKEEDVEIEVANFLIDSESIVDSLPLIYRNLFRITPVNDQELYVGRNDELDELKEAYNQWADNKRGAIAIVGEKWSGLTSFINHLEQEGLFKYQCSRFSAASSHEGLESLLGFLSEVSGEEIIASTTWDDIAKILNRGARKIIIIEDTQCFYFRKIGGFNNLIGLSELIQQTSNHILWVVTCNLYSWQYFQQTIQLDESFRFVIELQRPSEKEIEQLIEKRNRISGYKLQFIPSDADLNSKKFGKLSEQDQQKQLRERFFKNLNEFSSSNISMALMFWLLSTKEVTKDQIKIGEFKKPNFNFLSGLAMDKVFTLQLLILHDGLTYDQLADISRMSKSICHLLLGSLHEDGILLLKNEYYMVNPLIYRSIISLLKAKNLI